VGEHPPFLLKQVCDHNVRTLGEAAHVAGPHFMGTARANHCPLSKRFMILPF
jgi:hypothetical protein